MFCETNKSLGGKLYYPNSGSGCTIEVPGTRVHFQGKFCGGTNIVHVLLFCNTERSIISLKIIIFKFVQFCLEGKWKVTPFPGPFLCDARTDSRLIDKHLASKKDAYETFGLK